MLGKLAYVFGLFFVVVGVLGFVPSVTVDNQLFGVFHVNALHNVVHVVTGIAGLAAGFYGFPKVFFQVLGVVYLVLAVLGFYYGAQPILGLVANNSADTVLHLVVGAVAAYLGFCDRCCKVCG